MAVNNRNVTSMDVTGTVIVIADQKNIKDFKYLRPLIGSSKKMFKFIRDGKLKAGQIITHRATFRSMDTRSGIAREYVLRRCLRTERIVGSTPYIKWGEKSSG